jgi:hypothetical protein
MTLRTILLSLFLSAFVAATIAVGQPTAARGRTLDDGYAECAPRPADALAAALGFAPGR